MKAKDIKVGKTYRNAGSGRTQRRVLGIGVEFQPYDRFSSERPDDCPGVEFQQRFRQALPATFGDWSEPRRMWLDSFASWAGSEVTE